MAKLPYPLRIWATIRARQLVTRLQESSDSSDGIFFVLRAPDGWKLFPMRYSDFPEIDHVDAWETIAAPLLALWWAKRDPKRAKKLEDALLLHTYAFPRGRIERRGLTYRVAHGGDWQKFVSKNAIERAFGIQGKAIYERDAHEQCLEDDRDTVRQMLKIPETWPAVGSDYGFEDENK